MRLSEDSYAMLCVCGDIGVSLDSNLKPFTVVQWSNLAEKLVENDLRPRHLFDIEKEEVAGKMGLGDDEIERILRLLNRSGNIAVEISNLSNQGINILTRADQIYPSSLKEKLKKYAPPILYYAGNLSLLENPGVAVVGSRDIDNHGIEFTKKLAQRVTGDGLNIVSGGARGVDSIAEQVANDSDGTTVIVVSDTMEQRIQKKEVRMAIARKNSLILSPFRPDMPFRPYAAMERNKYVYALADYVVIVAAEHKKGGTWNGAEENRKKGWVPMFVRACDKMPSGNQTLLKDGSVHPITIEDILQTEESIDRWFSTRVSEETHKQRVEQISIFDKIE